MVARVKTDKNGRQKASGGCFLTFFWNKAVPKIVLYFFLKTIFYTVNSTSIIVEGKIMKIAMLIIVSLFILHGCTFLRYKINMCLWVCAGVFGCVQVHNVCSSISSHYVQLKFVLNHLEKQISVVPTYLLHKKNTFQH